MMMFSSQNVECRIATLGSGLIIICTTAIAQHWTDYEITCVFLSVCLSVCHHSYGCIFLFNLD